MSGYSSRQSSFADDDIAYASLFNNEFNQLVVAFSSTSGHKHDGTAGEGLYVPLIADSDKKNYITINTANNQLDFYVEVSGTAARQIYVVDGVINPSITNDIDIGSSTLKFKNLYLAGAIDVSTATIATATISAGTINSTSVGQTTPAAGKFTTLVSTGNTTIGDAAGDILTVNAGTVSFPNASTITLVANSISGNAISGGTIDSVTLDTPVINGTISGTAILDEDNFISNSNTHLATQQSIKSYVDSIVAGVGGALTIYGDSGNDTIVFATENLTITGGTGLTSAMTANTLTMNIDSTVATLTGTQTLTNKTLTAPVIDLSTVTSAGDLPVAAGGTGASTASAARTNLGLVIGTDVQAYDADLTTIGGLAKTDGNFIVGNGSAWVAESGATARTSLGLGSIATQAASSVAITGGSITGITPLDIAYGGTGASSASGAFNAIKQSASTSYPGVVEIADQTETDAGTDTAKPITPSTLANYTPVSGTGFAGGIETHVESTVGALSTGFDVNANIGAAWETIGPTGSGATNIWTAMDNIPTTANFVILKVICEAWSNNSGSNTMYGYARKGGDTTAIAEQLLIGRAWVQSTSGASCDSTTATHIVPLDSSNVFELYKATAGSLSSVGFDIYVVGYLE